MIEVAFVCYLESENNNQKKKMRQKQKGEQKEPTTSRYELFNIHVLLTTAVRRNYNSNCLADCKTYFLLMTFLLCYCSVAHGQLLKKKLLLKSFLKACNIPIFHCLFGITNIQAFSTRQRFSVTHYVRCLTRHSTIDLHLSCTFAV